MPETGDYSRKKKIAAIIKFVLLLIVIAGIPAFLYLKYGSEIFSKDSADRLVAYLMANKHISALIILILQILQVIICVIPGQPIQFAASYMLGVSGGLLLSLIGAAIGATIAFYLAKLLGRDMLYLFFDKNKVQDYQRKLNSGKGLLIVLLIYVLPGVPKDLVAYVAGISEMKFKPFIIISTIGRCPGMIGSLLLGHFYGAGNYRAIGVVIIAAVIFLIICFIKRKSLIKYLDKLEEKG